MLSRKIQDSSRRKDRKKGKASAEEQGGSGKTLRDRRGVERRDRNEKIYLHGPTDFAKTLELRFRVGDLDLLQRRKRYTSSREEKVDEHMCPHGKAIESKTHIVGYCEMHKEGRDVSEEEMGKIDEGNMEKFWYTS